MAFDPTPLLEARATIEDASAGRITRNELRLEGYEATRSFLRNAPGLIAGMDELKKSSSQPVKIPVFDKIPAGAGTDRKCSGTGTGTTALQDVTFTGITEEFSLSELEHAENLVGRDAALTYLLAEKSKAIYSRLEAAILTFLEAQKSPVNDGDFFGALSAGDAKQVAQADRDDFFSGAKAEMMANGFAGMTEFVGGYNLAQLYTHLAAQGAGNAQNTAYSVAGFVPNFSHVSNGAGVKGTAYMYQPGAVGLFTWTNALHRQGKDIGTDVWTTFTLPALPGMDQGIEVELKVKKGCTDSSLTIAGGHADFVESYVLHVDYALLGSYSSTTDTFIYKYELMDA